MNHFEKISKNKEILFGLFIISVYGLWALVYFIYSYFIKGNFSDPYVPLTDMKLELIWPLNNGLIMGSDIYGRSLMEVVSAGLTYSLAFSLIVTFLSATIGLVVGYGSVRARGPLRAFCELITNLVFIFPGILLAIIVMSFIGNSTIGLMSTLVFTGWAGYSRIVKGEAGRVLSLSYVEGALAIGMSEIRLFFQVIIPAIFPQMLIHMILGIGGVIISESTLGFLGLGGSEYSWGNLLLMSKSVLLEAPYLVFIISFFMANIIIGVNLLGDGLRDHLDPYRND